MRRSPSVEPHRPGSASALEASGFHLLSSALDRRLVERCRSGLVDLVGTGHALRHIDRRVPDLLNEVRTHLDPALSPILGTRPVILDATLFRKPPAANWQVPWHQDLQIAARRRVDRAGWGPWSRKEGVWHVQPPVAVLERLLAVRIHLSECGADDGPLRLLPGSHRPGVRPVGSLTDLGSRTAEYVCLACTGDVLLMRPLVLHASRIARGRSDRLVLHVVLAAADAVRGTALARPTSSAASLD